MSKPIRRVGVVGAGVMGSGIAAHCANAGVNVVLLDIVPPDLPEAERGSRAAKNRFAAQGLERVLSGKPPALFHPSAARLIEIGNTEDDFFRLAGCDLVIEAIVEKVEPKRALLARLEATAKSAIVASNTSGIRIADMAAGRSEAFKKRFLVMHFFNPVRHMKLLELVAGPDTEEGVLAQVRSFGEDVLGKGVVIGKDTPNFVGNRIGTHAMLTAIHTMMAEGLAPEDVDLLTGPVMGHPKSATFRTGDIVGIDTLVHVADNCFEALPGDEDRETFRVPDFVRTMVQRRLLGDKTKGGFSRKVADKTFETFDPRTLEYRPAAGDPDIAKAVKDLMKSPRLEDRLRLLVADPGKVGAFAFKLLARSLSYAAGRVGEIASSIASVDEAMRWGYNWELGPFETWDALGFAAFFDRMLKAGIEIPAAVRAMRDAGATSFYRPDGTVFDLATGKYIPHAEDPRTRPFSKVVRGDRAVLANPGAEAWDLGDGVLGVTFKTKANTVDGDVLALLGHAVDRAENDFRAMVIANTGDHFSVGANLFMIAMAASAKDFPAIERLIRMYQGLAQRMKYAAVPIVAAPYGMTLGGGLEICLAATSVQAAAETYTGLVETGVGIIPGGAGNLNLLWRALDALPEGVTVNTLEIVAHVFRLIALAKVSTSAEDAKALGLFRKTSGVSFDRARLVTEAKASAIGLAESGYHPPVPRAYRLPGESGIATLEVMIQTMVLGGQASAHDALIARKLAGVLCGGPSGASHAVTEEEFLERECEAFLSLVGEPKSIERMQYMVKNNKPLRN